MSVVCAQSGARQREVERRTLSNLAFCPNASAVGFDHGARDRKPQPGPRDVIAGRRFDAEIFFKQGDQIFRRNADALIRNADHNIVWAELSSNDDQSAVGRLLDRVVNDVAEDLFDPTRIGIQKRKLRRKV